MLAFYVERINTQKGISKYLKDIVNDKNACKYADIIIDFLEQFRPKFIEELKRYDEKIEEYIKFKNSVDDGNNE